MDSVDLVNALINNSTIDTSGGLRPEEVPTLNNAALAQEGYNRAAAIASLTPEELAMYEQANNRPMSLLELASMGQGAIQYGQDARALDRAGILEYGQAALGGFGEGFVSALAAPAAMAAGAQADLAMARENAIRERLGLPSIAHNYTGELTKAANDMAQGFGNWFRSNEQLQYAKADAAKRAARQQRDNLQYQQDLANGMGAGEAGFRDFLRSAVTGIENFADNPTNMVDTTSQLAGELVAQGLGAKGLGKALGTGTSTAGKVFNSTAATVVSEMASGVGDAAEAIEKLSDKQLLQQSPEFRQLYVENLAEGKTYEQAIKDARTELTRQASLLEIGSSGLAALLGAKFARPVERLMPNANAPISLVRDSLSEGIEEAITGFGQGVGTNIAAQQTYNPDQRIMEGVGAQTTEGALAGALGSATLRTPGSIVQGINDINQKVQSLSEQKEAEKANALETLNQADNAKQANLDNAVKVEEATVSEPDPLSPEDSSVETPYRKVTDSSGNVQYHHSNPNYDKPSSLDAKDVTNYKLDEILPEEARTSLIRALRYLNDKVKQKTATEEELNTYVGLVDRMKDNLKGHTDFIHLLKEKENRDYSSDEVYSNFNHLYAGILGDASLKDSFTEKVLEDNKKRNKSVYDFGLELNKNQEVAKKRLESYSNKALDKLAKVEDTSKAGAELKAVAKGLSQGTIDIAEPKVKKTILKIRNKANQTDDERVINSVYTILDKANKLNLLKGRNNGIFKVNNNLYHEDYGTKRAIGNIVFDITSAIANNNEKALDNHLERLNHVNLALTRKRRLQQQALKNLDNTKHTYVSYNSATQKEYVEQTYLGSLDLYDENADNQQKVATIQNAINEVVSSTYPDKQLSTAETVDELPDVDKLKDQFRKKYGTNKKSSSKATYTPNTSTTAESEVTTTPAQQAPQIKPTQPSVAPQQAVDTTPPPLDQEQEEEVQEQEETNSEPEESEEEATTPVVQESQDNTVDDEDNAEDDEDTEDKEDEVTVDIDKDIDDDADVDTEEKNAELNSEPETGEEETSAPTQQETKATDNTEAKEEEKDSTEADNAETEEEEKKDNSAQPQAVQPFTVPQVDIEKDIKQKVTTPVSLKKSKVSSPPKKKTAHPVTTSAQPQKATSASTPTPKQQIPFTINAINKAVVANTPIAPKVDPSTPEAGLEENTAVASFGSLPVAPSLPELRPYVAPKATVSFDLDDVDIPEEERELNRELISSAAAERAMINQQIEADVFGYKELTPDDKDLQEEINKSFKEKGYSTNVHYGILQTQTNHKDNPFTMKDLVKSIATTQWADNLSGSPEAKWSAQTRSIIGYAYDQVSNPTRIDYMTGDEMLEFAEKRMDLKQFYFKQQKEKQKTVWADLFTNEQNKHLEEEFKKAYDQADHDGKTNKDIIANWSKKFRTFTTGALAPKKEHPNDNLDNLGGYIKSNIAKGTPATEIAFGIKLENGELNCEHLTTERALAVFTEMDPISGVLHLNPKAEVTMAMATLATAQKIETRLNCKDDLALEESLNQFGLGKKDLAGLSEEDMVAFRYGMPVDSVTQDAATTFEDYAGFRNNNDTSQSLSGELLSRAFAELGTQFLIKQGIIRTQIFYFIPKYDSNGDALRDASGNIQYQRISSEAGALNKNPDKITLVYAVPTLAYADLDETNEGKDIGEPKTYKGKEIPEVSFLGVGNDDFLDRLFSHAPKRAFYTDPKDLPEAPTHQLRHPDVPLTPAQQQALLNQEQTPHELDKDFAFVMTAIEEAGVHAITGNGEDASGYYNDESAATLKGRRENLSRDYKKAIKRMLAALSANPLHPAIWGADDIHGGGRSQERMDNGDQASKLMRYMFPNVHELIDIFGTDTRAYEDHMNFKRAVLQAFGVKLKKNSDEEIDEIFDKVLTAFLDKYDGGNFDPKAYLNSVEGVLEAFDTIGSSFGGKPENAFIGLSATINLFKYAKAVKTNGQFINTLPIEFDGSCHGFAMAHWLMDASKEFTVQTIKAMYRSDIYPGLDRTSSIEMQKALGEDNYTANAAACQAKVAACINNVLQREAEGRAPISLAVEDPITGETIVLTEKDLMLDIFSLIGNLSNGNLTINEEALQAAAVNGSSDNVGKIVDIARIASKGPTMRVNYGQGAAQNAVETWNELSADFSLKLSDIIQANQEGNEVPPYKVYFKKELEKGEMSEDQAFAKFQGIGRALYFLNNYSIEAVEDTAPNGRPLGTFRERIVKAEQEIPMLDLFKLGKDEVPNKDQLKELRKFTLSNTDNYSPNLMSSFRQFYSDHMYDAVNEARTSGYKGFMNLIVSLYSVSAEMAGTVIIEQIHKKITDNGGLLPSNNEVLDIRKKTAQYFPTIVKGSGTNLDLARSAKTNVNVLKKTRQKDKSFKEREVNATRITSCSLNNSTVEQGPFAGEKVMATLHTDQLARIPVPNGVGPIAITTIANSDGMMQLILFLMKQLDRSAVNRYDGVDIAVKAAQDAGVYINEAARATIQNIITIGHIENATKLVAGMMTFSNEYKALGNTPEDIKRKEYLNMIANALHRALCIYNPAYLKEAKRKGRDPTFTPSFDELQTILKKYFLDKIREYHKNLFINNVVKASLPMTMAHMSVSAQAYRVRDRRDTFEVDPTLSIDATLEAVAKEAQRRREIVEKHYKEIYSHYLRTGVFKIPDEVFENPISTYNGVSYAFNSDPLLLPIPTPYRRSLPNVRSPNNREVAANAPVDQAPPRDTVAVQPQQTTIRNKGRQSTFLQNMVKTFLNTNPALMSDRFTRRDLQNFLDTFLETNTKDMQVKTATIAELTKAGFATDLTDTSGLFVPEDNTLYLIKDNFSKKDKAEKAEVVVHELIHALTASRIAAIYNDKDHPLRENLLRLAQLRIEFGHRLKQSDPAKYDDFNNRVNKGDQLTKIQEFVAYMLTDPDYLEFAKTEQYLHKNLKHKILGLFRHFTKLFMQIFGLKSKKDLRYYMSFYGQTLLHTTAIVAAVKPDTNHGGALLKYTNKGNGINLAQWAAKLEDITNVITANDSLKKGQFKAKQASIAADIRDLMQESGFSHLSNQELLVASGIATLYSSSAKLDSSTKLDAFELRELVAKSLKPEDFAFPQDGNDMSLAQKRYDFITGVTKQEALGEDSSLGIFMGLSLVSPQVKSILKNANIKVQKRLLGTERVLALSESPIDAALTSLGNRALQAINALSSIKNKPKGVIETIASLNRDLVEIQKKASILEKPTNLVDNLNNGVVNKVDEAGTRFLQGDTLKKWATSDKGFLQFLAHSLNLTVPLLLKEDNSFYIAHKKTILELVNTYERDNPGMLSRFFITAYRELVSADEQADKIFAAEKEAKAVIQATRNNWREVAPREIKKHFTDEGVRLTDKDNAVLNTVILKSDLGTLDSATIASVMTGNLNKEINKRKAQLSDIAIEKSEQLAKYLITRRASQGMLRNAEAISIFALDQRIRSKSRRPKDNLVKDSTVAIDELVTLLALKEDMKTFNRAREIYAQAPNAFTYTVSQQRQNKEAEMAKVMLNNKNRYNYYKGFFPENTVTPTNVQVVPVEAMSYYKSLGYKSIGTSFDKNFAYMQSTIDPMSTFNQGGLQSIINQTGGVDAVTGWSPNSRVFKRIKSPKVVERLTLAIPTMADRPEAYLPVLDETGSEIIGYEIAIDPEKFSSVSYETDFAKNLGAWKGRQIEEQLARDFNKELVKTVKEMYEEASPSEQKTNFVDLIQLAKKDPLVKDALDNLSPETLIELSGKPRLPKEFFVRRDLISDIIGRRQASVIDLKTGLTYWNPRVQRALVNALEGVVGKKALYYLYRGEKFTNALISSARNFIVIRSGEVMVFNLLGNFVSLLVRGVPLNEILTLAPKIVKELEHFNRSRQKQVIIEMALNAEKGKDNPDERKIAALERRLEQEKAMISNLTYSGDLLKAGEYNTIADLGDVNDDILLSTGKWGEYIEKQVDKLPDVLKEGGRQLILSKDTALYRGLEKGTQYGDFVAKAILYHHLITRKNVKPNRALSKVRYEYVNYDMLPGRTREYLENIGLLWFYNYKLRSVRTMVSMLKENPLGSVISLFSPISLDLDIGTALTDNFFSKLITNPFGSIGPKILDLPWITNHLWYNMFS